MRVREQNLLNCKISFLSQPPTFLFDLGVKYDQNMFLTGFLRLLYCNLLYKHYLILTHLMLHFIAFRINVLVLLVNLDRHCFCKWMMTKFALFQYVCCNVVIKWVFPSLWVVFLQHSTEMTTWQPCKYLQNLHLMKAQSTIENNTNDSENRMLWTHIYFFISFSSSSWWIIRASVFINLTPAKDKRKELRQRDSERWMERAWGWKDDSEKSCLGWVEGCWGRECLSCGVSSVPVCPADVPRSRASDCPFQRSHLQESISETGSQSLVCMCQSDCCHLPSGCCWPQFWPFQCHYVFLFLKKNNIVHADIHAQMRYLQRCSCMVSVCSALSESDLTQSVDMLPTAVCSGIR